MSDTSGSISFVGIDPGAYGGIAIYQKYKEQKPSWILQQLPTIEVRVNRFELNLSAIYNFLVKSNSECPFVAVALEDPPYIPTNGGFSTRALTKSYGELRGMLSTFDTKLITPGPKVWQAAIIPGKPTGKESTIAHVQVTYPGIVLPAHPRAPRKLHDGLADAVCLAEYAKQKYYASGDDK